MLLSVFIPSHGEVPVHIRVRVRFVCPFCEGFVVMLGAAGGSSVHVESRRIPWGDEMLETSALLLRGIITVECVS